MTSHDHVVLVDQDWIGKAVLLDIISNLFDLLFGMGACIARIGGQACSIEIFNSKFICHYTYSTDRLTLKLSPTWRSSCSHYNRSDAELEQNSARHSDSYWRKRAIGAAKAPPKTEMCCNFSQMPAHPIPAAI